MEKGTRKSRRGFFGTSRPGNEFLVCPSPVQRSPGDTAPYSQRKPTLLCAVCAKLPSFPLNCGLLSDGSHGFTVLLTTTVCFQTHRWGRRKATKEFKVNVLAAGMCVCWPAEKRRVLDVLSRPGCPPEGNIRLCGDSVLWCPEESELLRFLTVVGHEHSEC